MIATTLATIVLAVAGGGPDEPAPCQTQACHRRVARKHWRKTIRPHRSWLERVEMCESGGDPNALSPDGTYTGLHQFDDRTWHSVGGSGRAKDASVLQQRYRAVKLLKLRGGAPWPVCGT